MAIRLRQAGAIIYEVPKTGTTWMRRALENAGIAFDDLLPAAAVTQRHGMPMHFAVGSSRTFATIREPLSWARSWYRFQVQNEWISYEPGRWCWPIWATEKCSWTRGR